MLFHDLLVDANTKVNLTKILNWPDVIVRHYLDSLSLVMAAPSLFHEREKILDIGSGFGIPGIPLKVMFPGNDLVMLDSVKKKVELEDCLFATNHEGAIHSKLNLRFTGCAALDLAYVASGRFDGYFHNKINIWDIAAGVLIINEAGGKVNDINKFDINSIDIRASNNNIHNKMLENLKNF